MNQNRMNEKNNVIPFPKLAERLLEKGMEALQAKQFKDALHIFDQLLALKDEENPEVEVGKVICLIELGLYEDAKENCARLLHEDIGDYFNVLQIYLTILIQLSEYDEVVSILEALFAEERIPSAQAEAFFHLLEFAKNSQEHPIDRESPTVDLYEIEQQLLRGNPEQQLYAIHKLRDAPNIMTIIGSIKQILIDEASHPVIQSMLIYLLMERNINETVVVQKFQRTLTLDINEAKPVFEQPFSIEVLNQLDDTLGQENPTLFEHVKQLWERFLFVLYPLHPELQNVLIWAAALHKIGYELYGIEIADQELLEIYQINMDDIASCCREIRELEELSNIGMNG